MAKELNQIVPQSAVTTFGFSSVWFFFYCILTVAGLDGGEVGGNGWVGPAGADVGGRRRRVQRQIPTGVHRRGEERGGIGAGWTKKDMWNVIRLIFAMARQLHLDIRRIIDKSHRKQQLIQVILQSSYSATAVVEFVRFLFSHICVRIRKTSFMQLLYGELEKPLI